MRVFFVVSEFFGHFGVEKKREKEEEKEKNEKETKETRKNQMTNFVVSICCG